MHLGSFMLTFDASRRLISHAEFKINKLELEINQHLDENVKLIIETYPHMAYVIADIKKPIPDHFGFEVIEAVGHVRSALDKMIADLVIANGRGVSGVAFPFGGIGQAGVREPFPSKRHDGIKKKLPVDQWKLIIEQKPYPGGNDLLWSINNVANAAKHGPGLVEMNANHLPKLTRYNFISYESPIAEFGEIRSFGSIDANAFGKHTILQLINLKGDLELKETLRIVFREVAPVAGKDVLVVLHQQVSLVKEIIDRFSRTSE